MKAPRCWLVPYSRWQLGALGPAASCARDRARSRRGERWRVCLVATAITPQCIRPASHPSPSRRSGRCRPDMGTCGWTGTGTGTATTGPGAAATGSRRAPATPTCPPIRLRRRPPGLLPRLLAGRQRLPRVRLRRLAGRPAAAWRAQPQTPPHVWRTQPAHNNWRGRRRLARPPAGVAGARLPAPALPAAAAGAQAGGSAPPAPAPAGAGWRAAGQLPLPAPGPGRLLAGAAAARHLLPAPAPAGAGWRAGGAAPAPRPRPPTPSARRRAAGAVRRPLRRPALRRPPCRRSWLRRLAGPRAARRRAPACRPAPPAGRRPAIRPRDRRAQPAASAAPPPGHSPGGTPPRPAWARRASAAAPRAAWARRILPARRLRRVRRPWAAATPSAAAPAAPPPSMGGGSASAAAARAPPPADGRRRPFVRARRAPGGGRPAALAGQRAPRPAPRQPATRAAAAAPPEASQRACEAAPPTAPQQDVLREVLVLEDPLQALAHVGGGDRDRRLAELGRLERQIVEHALHDRVQPAGADVLHARVHQRRDARDLGDRVGADVERHLLRREQRRVLLGQRVLGLGQDADEVLIGQRLQLDADGEPPLQLGDQVLGLRHVERARRDEQHVIGLERPVLGRHRRALDDRQQVALHALA